MAQGELLTTGELLASYTMVNSKSINIPKVLESLEGGATPKTLEKIHNAWCNTNKCWYAIWDYKGHIPKLEEGVRKIQAILKVMNLIPNLMERFNSGFYPKNQDEVDKMP